MLPNSPVRLERTTEPIYNNGYPYVMLSPNGNAKNIRKLYDVIRTEKDSQALRADYTVGGQPWIGFAQKTKKSAADPVATANITKQRQELLEILLRTTETVEKKFKYLTQAQRDANRALKTFAITAPLDRDIKVGDIKPHLKVLNRAYGESTTKAWQEKQIEHYRDPVDAGKIKRQRAQQFLSMESSTRLMLVNALTRPDDRSPEQAIAGIKAMDDFLRNFLHPKEPYRQMVRKVANNTELLFFCRRWLSAHPRSGKDATVYQSDPKFKPYPWARLLDTLCRLIIKECRRQTVISAESDDRFAKGSVVLRRSSSAHLQHIRSGEASRPVVDVNQFPCMRPDAISQLTAIGKTKKD
ncbi:MAG: hypothetical protein FGM20_01380 [Burkholderiaceae bacterium]|jgi:hypothetical protein|nr:hypothetical protein [Burkholderiaceae bacterium]NCW86342.1 hypothetical protein [Oxalobacteraceae bacterium]